MREESGAKHEAPRSVGVTVALLAGGLGTRLGGALGDLPKVMAPVDGRPFLDHLLDRLSATREVRRVVLCLGHKAGPVLAHLETVHHAFEIVPLVEPEPLGTAGALAFAGRWLDGDPVLVMNGDTFVDFDLGRFVGEHRRRGLDASLLSVKSQFTGRYGRLDLDDDGRVIRFREKDPTDTEAGWINAGVYAFGPNLRDRISRIGKGSLERDVLQKLPQGAIAAIPCDGRFIDIGTPESLARAPQIVERAEPIEEGSRRSARL